MIPARILSGAAGFSFRHGRRPAGVLWAVLGLSAALAGATARASTNAADGFGEFAPLSETEFVGNAGNTAASCPARCPMAEASWFALGAALAAGVAVRFRALRPVRPLFLVASVAVLGFALGGCPCPISSFQSGILGLLNADRGCSTLVWFLGLLPVTFLVGRTWCGWVCHLGALQELVHRPGVALRERGGERLRKVLLVSWYAALAALLVQLAVMRRNWFCAADPFRAAFNLMAPSAWGWAALALTLAVSVYVYRPFCRGLCPVGLVLGWISLVPGAALLRRTAGCRGCARCESACPAIAIGGDGHVRAPECLACGRCLDACGDGEIRFGRRRYGLENGKR